VLQSAGLLGAQIIAPLAYSVLHDEERAFAGTLVVGAATGLYLGQRWGMSGELTPGDGLLVLGGHLAGGAGALGVTYLLDDDDRDPTVYLATSAVGSLVGSVLTYRAVRGGADPMAAPGVGPTRVELSPFGLLAPAGSAAPVVTIRF
jgi:hypothetical protein